MHGPTPPVGALPQPPNATGVENRHKTASSGGVTQSECSSITSGPPGLRLLSAHSPHHDQSVPPPCPLSRLTSRCPSVGTKKPGLASRLARVTFSSSVSHSYPDYSRCSPGRFAGGAVPDCPFGSWGGLTPDAWGRMPPFASSASSCLVVECPRFPRFSGSSAIRSLHFEELDQVAAFVSDQHPHRVRNFPRDFTVLVGEVRLLDV